MGSWSLHRRRLSRSCLGPQTPPRAMLPCTGCTDNAWSPGPVEASLPGSWESGVCGFIFVLSSEPLGEGSGSPERPVRLWIADMASMVVTCLQTAAAALEELGVPGRQGLHGLKKAQCPVRAWEERSGRALGLLGCVLREVAQLCRVAGSCFSEPPPLCLLSRGQDPEWGARGAVVGPGLTWEGFLVADCCLDCEVVTSVLAF